ncbi:hypothetical protein CCACVL1_18578 [Corchorus capsularis]|uniref:Uncharacterized protein n=1 Tax=Corchorus capsularis TaxID=210143 RepID=A0A1R3HKT7_COCAP|nr:hypothetical protein CCACVL1_18578 [Corchorus capsularis]
MAVSPKQKMSSVNVYASSYYRTIVRKYAKRGRLPNIKLIRKKPSRLDKMTLLNQVYIVPKKGSDVALGPVKLEASIQEMDRGKSSILKRKPKIEPGKSSLFSVAFFFLYQLKLSSESFFTKISQCVTERKPNIEPIECHSETDSDDIGFDGIKMCHSLTDFKNVTSFEDFIVVVNGLIIKNSELLPKDIQKKYYDLCCSQKAYLHDHLIKGFNCKLVCGMICETIKIAEAIRAANLTTSQRSFETWNKTLKSFEGLGMNVGFLRARLEQLMNLSLKLKRYQEASVEQANLQEEKT